MDEYELVAFLKKLESLLVEEKHVEVLEKVRHQLDKHDAQHKIARLKEVLETLAISSRTRNALIRDYGRDLMFCSQESSNWTTIDIEHLEIVSDKQFLSFRQFGPTCLADIRQAFAKKAQESPVDS